MPRANCSTLVYLVAAQVGSILKLHETIIQTDPIFVANNTYLSIVFNKNKTFIPTVTQDHIIQQNGMPASY